MWIRIFERFGTKNGKVTVAGAALLALFAALLAIGICLAAG
ncbi:hypothetical protein [Paenibacillus sp. GYB003]